MGELASFSNHSHILVQLDILATIPSFSRCGSSLYCLQTIMGQLTLFPCNSCILVQLDILAIIPSFSRYSPNLFCLHTIMGQFTLFPYNSCILVQFDILVTIPSLVDAAQIFTVCRPSWVNSLYFHIILAFLSNPKFWPLFPDVAGAAQFSFYSVMGKLIGYILVKSRILRNSTFWLMSRFRIWECQRCFPQEIMYLWSACEITLHPFVCLLLLGDDTTPI